MERVPQWTADSREMDHTDDRSDAESMPARRARRGWRGVTLSGMLAAAVAGAGVAVGPRLVDVLFPPDAYEQVDAEFGEQLLAIPGFEERFGDLDDAAEAFEAGVELGSGAIGRVDDATLLEWADVMVAMLRAVDVPSCAAIARGTPPTDIDMSAVDVDTYRRLAEIVVEMARLELTNAPRHEAPSAAEMEAARLAFVEQLGLARAQELAKTDIAAASDDDACSAIRDILEAMKAVDGPERVHLLRDVGESLSA